MPRHPPIALKTLDRSHCQYPSRDPEGIVASATPCAGYYWLELAQKDQLLEIRSRARLGKPIIGKGLSVPCDKSQLYSHEVRTNLLFTMSNRTGAEPRSSAQTLFRMTFLTSTRHDDPADRALAKPQRGGRKRPILRIAHWWSRTGSNRRHPACKAGALPAELRPLIVFSLTR